MTDQAMDINTSLMVDGNAVAGLLQELFAVEMTVAPVGCASCGREGELGSLRAYLHGPGVVLRCPGCGAVMLRIVQTPRANYLDARGAAFLCIPVG